MLVEFAAFAEELAARARAIMQEAYISPSHVQLKQDRTLVTATDLAVEQAISRLIAERYPTHGIYGEEQQRRNSEAEYQWVIDPIDGTNAFIARIPTFTTLIALCKNNTPLLGLIEQPILKERWLSTEMRASGDATVELSGSLLATTSIPYFSASQLARFDKLRAACGGCIHSGDAYLYGKLAGGNIGLVVDAGLKPYDFCALPPIVEASGGIMTDWEGNRLTLASSGNVIAAASKELHQQAMEILHG